MEVVGRFANASNATLLVRLRDRDPRTLADLEQDLGRAPQLEDMDPGDLAVYKPQRGERPLWDFPPGTLHRREVAAAQVSEALGWGLVPTTVLREDAPFGVGSVQRFVPHDPEQHYFTLLEQDDPAVTARLVEVVLFDLVIDNADRKAGHLLVAEADTSGSPPSIWCVDHGLSFNTAHKLRTVAWDLAGTDVTEVHRARLRAVAAALQGPLGAALADLLDDDELTVLVRRVTRLLDLEVLPEPIGDHPYPWPLL